MKTRGLRYSAFTLIELLVVVAIIALLISILLPSLTCAREQARSATCGATLRDLGISLKIYIQNNNDWIPGANTSGMATAAAAAAGDLAMLRDERVPTQVYDWMTPSLFGTTTLGNTRAEQMKTLINDFSCPSQRGVGIDTLFAVNTAPDQADFSEDLIAGWQPLSYLMPAHFQHWGSAFRDQRRLVKATNGTQIPQLLYATRTYFAARHRGRYQSKIEQVGDQALKIAAADATRFLDFDGILDFTVDPAPNAHDGDPFGSFTSNGAWWCGSQAYGVAQGTSNWDGLPVSSGTDDPHGQGENMLLSYRHGCTGRDNIPRAAQDNEGSINAMFFDGHVERLNDRQSREIQYWYPRGAKVSTPNEGMTTVPFDFVVP